MSSAQKEIVVNPLERALSGDIMRGQNFAGAMFSEFMRALLSTSMGTDDVQAGAQWAQKTTQGNPAWAQVVSGVLFQPTGGSTASAVTAGTVMMYDPDASPSADDSQYKLLEDPGTTSVLTTSITLTTNSSGSLRVDVLECARVQPDNVLETDSRDVFNTTTGTFSAAAVNKVTQGQLQYRIRVGTAGAGFPGTSQGWMPICVMSVPTGTTVWDTVTIWDVRPLLEDRLFSLTDAARDLPAVTRCMAQIDSSSSSNSNLTGVVEAQLGSRRVGGSLRPSGPAVAGADAEFIALDNDANNQSATGGISTSGFNYIYICAPFGLPGWRKYTLGPASRVPRSPRGLVFNSPVAPNLAYGTPSSPLNLPPYLQATGNTATDSNAVCVLARIGTHAGVRGVSSLVASGGIHMSTPNTAPNTGVVSGSVVNFTLVAGTDFPPHARAIHVFMEVLVTWTPAQVAVAMDAGTVAVAPTTSTSGCIATVQTPRSQAAGFNQTGGGTYTGPGSYVMNVGVRIPIPTQYQLLGVPGTTPPGAVVSILAQWAPNIILASGSPTLSSAVLNVQGWELIDAD
jgi:hypothetical protein